jgi:hypothetical protein
MAPRKNGHAPDLLDDLLALSAQEVIETPGAKFKLYATAISAAEMRAIYDDCLLPGKTFADEDAFDNDKLEVVIIARSVRDGKGRKIPTARVMELKKVNNPLYVRMQSAASRVNGLGQGIESAGNV